MQETFELYKEKVFELKKIYDAMSDKKLFKIKNFLER